MQEKLSAQRLPTEYAGSSNFDYTDSQKQAQFGVKAQSDEKPKTLKKEEIKAPEQPIEPVKKETKEEQETENEDKKQTDEVKPAVKVKPIQKSRVQDSKKSVKSLETESETASQKTDKAKTIKKEENQTSESLKASFKTESSKPTVQQQTNKKAPISSLTGNEISQCPIFMPKIKSAIVYQSVEAPQIEPMDGQEFQKDPDNPSFRSYDLVMGKPAGVLIELDRTRIDKKTEFAIDLAIGENPLRKKCFHEPMNKKIIEGEEDYCLFKEIDLKKEGLFKFFPLPMKESFLKKEGLVIPIKVTLYPRNYRKNKSCYQEKTFEIKIYKIADLKLGFTRIDGGQNCFASINNIDSGYNPTSYKTVKSFANSVEVLSIKSMFPLKSLYSKSVTYSINGKFYDYIDGYCSNRPHKKARSDTIGILEDISFLENVRASLNYDKLLAIVPNSYFEFHRSSDHNSVGFVISPKWDWRWFWFMSWKTDFIGGSWNIVFVRDDQLNKGAIVHELAHTLGEEKEHYQSAEENCRRFNGSSYEPCSEYMVEMALDTSVDKSGRQGYQFKKDKFSIMNSKKGIENLWILRDTFQKVFKVLSKKAVIPNNEKLHGRSLKYNPYYRREDENSLKAVISGFYYEKDSSFVLPKIKLKKTKLLTPSLYPKTVNTKLPVITFQLREDKKILKTIKRPILKMQLKTLYKDKTPKIEDFVFSPTIAVFKLPLDFRDRKLSIYVVSPYKTIIFKTPIKFKKKGLISLNKKI